MRNSNKTNTIGKVSRVSVADQVFDIMQEQIISEEWASGTQIPSEADLCEMLGVSRVSVRAAIQKLTALGLLEVRKGEGTFVKNFSLRSYLEKVSPMIFKGKSLDEVKQFRQSIESACIRIAIDIYDEKEIEKLSNLVEVSEDAYKRDDAEAYLEYDYKFHRQLCKMSHNSIFLMMFDSFSNSFFDITNSNLQVVVSKSQVTDISQHLELVKAIKAKDYELAQKNICKIIYVE